MDTLEKLNTLKSKNAILMCTYTNKVYNLGPEENGNIFLLSSSGYRELPIYNVKFEEQDDTGMQLIKGMTSLNGYDAYSSPFEAVIYIPLTNDNNCLKNT